ncbi:diphthine--ammonia ligase isoform X1 [Punica granatum]|uniref:Diphthine--ammonia ligase n=2 Tax=Punica granatum TaxID=22663 RepID=A0A6P8CJW3_PUNGR|nr:diphthine--ammonia ligase isoform X1 [Punica granatum]
MKVVALVSGGKDSCFAMMKCIHYGHDIVALANLMPADDSVDELDSYMYQTVGHQIIESYAKCMGIPLFRRRIQGSTRHQSLSYRRTPGDEVEDMYFLLKRVKQQIPSVQAVSSGAIASDYQRLRVESVCSRLGLVSLAYLWKQDQSLLLQEMIDSGIKAITVKVAAMGLDPAKHLGKELSILFPYLHKLKELYGINVCGEGGEYETLTLDCPLFINARIVLEEFQIVLHSPDSIAPVGILHPLAFQLEDKAESSLLVIHPGADDLYHKRTGLVYEVQDDGLDGCEGKCESLGDATALVDATEDRLRISVKQKTQFSISCCLQDPCEASTAGLQEDLKDVLGKIEARLVCYGLHWKDVFYIHLYIANMDEFAVANDTYVKFITQDNCPFGVPSRSTIEVPLSQVGLGKAYIEVLVASDESKRVLHVQSISCWAPSCIGPYSQATLHKNILHMAGQLGLDPPTMNLCSDGPLAEVEQALRNSEAVAKSFGCSISTSAISFVIYCSANIPSSERCKIQDKLHAFLKQMGSSFVGRPSAKVLDPVFLYALVPNLPKSALVEVKPLLHIQEDAETISQGTPSTRIPSSWSFQPESWHDSLIEKCVVDERFCAVILSITSEVVVGICSDADEKSQDHELNFSKRTMERISRFCICLLDKILMEHSFSWEEIMNLRFYFPTRLGMSHKTLSDIFKSVFTELIETGQNVNAEEPMFNLVPVLGAGRSAASMDDILTCELFAQRF